MDFTGGAWAGGPELWAGKAAAQPSGLASLDVEFPERGVEYMFTTPRGEVEITARAVTTPLVDRLTRLVWVLAAVAVLLFLFQLARRGAPKIGSRAGGLILIIGGGLGVLSCTLTILSLIAIVVGILLIIRSTPVPRSATAPSPN